MTTFITADEYLQNKGKFHRNESVYDSKGDFLGWFNKYSDCNELMIRTPHEEIKNFWPYEIMVEIEVKPIYIAV